MNTSGGGIYDDVIIRRLHERLLPIRLHDVVQTAPETLRLKIEHNDYG